MILLRKETLPAAGPILASTDEASEELLRKMKDGQVVAVTAKRARSPQHHRKFFAMLGSVFDNQDQFKSVDDLLDALKLEVGHSKLKERLNGERWREPKSISFHSMGQDEFNKFYDQAINKLCAHFNLDRETLEQESPPDPHRGGAEPSPANTEPDGVPPTGDGSNPHTDAGEPRENNLRADGTPIVICILPTEGDSA